MNDGHSHPDHENELAAAATPGPSAGAAPAPPRQKPQALGLLRPGVDGYTLAGDGDILHAKTTLSYRISDPVSYTFNFVNPTNLLQHILDNALFYASARFSADDALYRNKLAFQEMVQARVEQMVETLKLGVRIEAGEGANDTATPIDMGQTLNNLTKTQPQS